MIESGLKRLDEADLRDGEELQRETDTIGEEEEHIRGEKELQRDNDTFEEEEVDLRQQEEDTADVEKNTEIPDQTVQVLGICLISFINILTSTFILIVAMVIMIVALMILLILRETRNIGDSGKANENPEKKTVGDQLKELLGDLWTAFRQPTLILLVVSASLRQIAGLAWANNNVNYFNQYYQDVTVDFYWLTVCSICGGAVGVVSGNLSL